MKTDFQALEDKARRIRMDLLNTCVKAGKGHVSSCFSCIDIMVALYYSGIMRFDPANEKWDRRDRFILSKGQASPGLYTVLADLGFFPKSELERFAQKNGMFGVHLQESVPGVELTVGSLGQAYGIAAGMAKAAHLRNQHHLVYALLGDGECYEGSIWETAMFAAHHRLNNLVTIVDRNSMCVMDWTENLLAMEPLEEKWAAFGFEVKRIDGHSLPDLVRELERARRRYSSKPTVIIADTVKGHGADAICHDPAWHGCAPPPEVGKICLEQLEKGVRHDG